MRGGRGGGGGGRRNLSSSSSGSKKLECSSRVYKKRVEEEEEEEEEEHENNGVDIISNLPEHILHHIFTFVDIKQAIQTCILSRRWRYFWGSLPSLKFRFNGGSRKIIRNEFMNFVDRVLMFRSNSSSIDEFTLSTCTIDVTDRLNTWILASVIRNVQQLTLNTDFSEKFQFHHCLFTCKSLTKLVLGAEYKCVNLPDSITLPRLKNLSLSSVQFEDEDSTNQLFSSCPILESLTIRSCAFSRIIVNISSPLLQHLVIENCSTRSNALDLDLDPVETHFQLCAPNLISFYWSNNMSKHCAPNNFSSLVKADISTNVYEDSKLSKEKKAIYVPFMVNLFRGLHNVEDLTLSAAFLEVFMGSPCLLDSQPTKLYNLRCLKLTGTWRSVDCIHAMSYLLKISPNIEALFVEVNYGAPIENLSFGVSYSNDKMANDKMHPYWNPDEITSNSAKRGDYWKAWLSLEGLLNHVKCFKLGKVEGRINELEFIEILLKNAMMLEELLIFFKMHDPHDKEKERRMAKFSEKVLTFPKASSNVVIMFEYVKCYY